MEIRLKCPSCVTRSNKFQRPPKFAIKHEVKHSLSNRRTNKISLFEMMVTARWSTPPLITEDLSIVNEF